MRVRWTVVADGKRHEVEVTGPPGAVLSDVRPELFARLDRAATDAMLWSGDRVLARDSMVGGPGLRDGSVISVDRPLRREPAGAVLQLHVVCGPDAGLVRPLTRGPITVGRAADCDVRLTDPDVSRHHVELTVTSHGVFVHDLGSTNGSRLLVDDGEPSEAVDGVAIAFPLGRCLEIGDTLISVVAVAAPAAATTPVEDGRLAVNRPPRLTRQLPVREVVLEPEPNPPARLAVPWLAALLPALAGAGLAWFLHNMQFLAFALLSPLLMLGSAYGERLSGRGRRRRDRTESLRRSARTAEEIRSLAVAETSFRRAADPDPATLLVTAMTPTSRVWERRRGDPDLLDVRVGVGSAAATFTVRRGHAEEPVPLLVAVPVTVALRHGPVGIFGPRAVGLSLARSLLAHVAVLHSPADVSVAALVSGSAAPWTWLRWLPHARHEAGGEPWIARTAAQQVELVGHLAGVLDGRLTSLSSGNEWSGPWLVLLLDHADVGEFAGLGRILDCGPRVGITAICLDDDSSRLPAACTAIVSVTGDHGSRVRVRTSDGRDEGVLADQVSRPWAERVARALCPLRNPDDGAAALPTEVRLVELLQLHDKGSDPSAHTQSAISEIRSRWVRSAGTACTRLGVARDGPVEVDLARDGPHALVAGTTGSGKSELLRSLVAGMAVNAPPSDLQFVLIDYKGGAAFADCARLPHTSGLVTDLDPSLTERALVSLDAELRRRERAFAAAGVTGLTEYRSTAEAVDEPLARLVIVVDEFAALADDLPDFLAGLISIAQRGRSLGVHLVLATQRPGGAVSPEIRANTTLRIALRVTDPGESSDIIGRTDAARIDKGTPGRAVLTTGADTVVLQTAFAGRAPSHHPADPSVTLLDEWGAPVGPAAAAPDARRPNDLAVLVDLIREAARGGQPARRPWLDPLPAVVPAGSLASDSDPFVLAYALADHPRTQSQAPDCIDLRAGGSLLLTGTAGSGRTTALRTIVGAATTRLSADDVHVYLIDCSGGALAELAGLPHCGAALGIGHGREIDRLLTRLGLEVTRRRTARTGSGPGGGPSSGPAEPALLLAVDGWEGLAATCEPVAGGQSIDTLLHLLRDGPAAGVTVLITGDRASLTARLTGLVQRRLVLRMADRDDYVLAGIARRHVTTRLVPGRAISPDGIERQLAVPDLDEQFIERSPSPLRAPFRIRPLPSHVRLRHLPIPVERDRITLGVVGDSADPVTVGINGCRAEGGLRLLFAGPPRSGRSTALASVAAQLTTAGGRTLIVAGLRSPLRAAAVGARQPVGPADPLDHPELEAARAAVHDGAALSIVVDDSEQFLDTAVGDWLALLARSGPPRLAMFASARTDDVAVAYRGLASELRRYRNGLLLQPAPGDGEIFGIRVPYNRIDHPPGRGYLIADGLMTPAGPPNEAALPIQVAVP